MSRPAGQHPRSRDRRRPRFASASAPAGATAFRGLALDQALVGAGIAPATSAPTILTSCSSSTVATLGAAGAAPERWRGHRGLRVEVEARREGHARGPGHDCTASGSAEPFVSCRPAVG